MADEGPARGSGTSSWPEPDQRGVSRPFGAGCDIGAYEVRPPEATTGAASAITGDGATLAGAITPNSGDASVHFDFGPGPPMARRARASTSAASARWLSQQASPTLPPTPPTTTGWWRRAPTAPPWAPIRHSPRPRPPQNTVISKAKISSAKHRATFRFHATGHATGFQCALVSKKRRQPRFKGCRSPKPYRKLKRGKYLFEVRAVGPIGPDPSPAKRKFKIA